MRKIVIFSNKNEVKKKKLFFCEKKVKRFVCLLLTSTVYLKNCMTEVQKKNRPCFQNAIVYCKRHGKQRQICSSSESPRFRLGS